CYLHSRPPPSSPTRRSSDLAFLRLGRPVPAGVWTFCAHSTDRTFRVVVLLRVCCLLRLAARAFQRAGHGSGRHALHEKTREPPGDRKSTRLNSSHVATTYAV